MNNSNEPMKVVVDLQMPFLSIVTLMVKWALASVPAIIILATIFGVVPRLVGGVMEHDDDAFVSDWCLVRRVIP